MTIPLARFSQSDIFLRPGEFHFGGGGASVATVLGSCVSLTVWHPALRIGGMCHFLLPTRCSRSPADAEALYADEAIALFMQAMARHGTCPQDYQAKLFGGANMFPDIRAPAVRDVGARNIEAGRRLAQASGLTIVAEDVGGVGHRRIILDMSSGDVWARQIAETVPPALDMPPLPDFGQRRE